MTKQAALVWVKDRAVPVDSDGEVIDREVLELPKEEDDDPDAAEPPGAEAGDPEGRGRPDIEADDGQDIDEEQEGS